MRLGILADTHDELALVRTAVGMLIAAGAQSLVHCGDFIGPDILRLCGVLPCYFAFGNNDADMVPALREAAAEIGAVCLNWGGVKFTSSFVVMQAPGRTYSAASPTDPLLVVGRSGILPGKTEVSRELLFVDYMNGSQPELPCKQSVAGVAFASDGKSVFVTTEDGRIEVYDPRTRTLIDQTKEAAGTSFWAPAVNADGSAVVVQGNPQGLFNRLMVWRRGEPRPRELPYSLCWSFALAPDGKSIALVTPGKTIRFMPVDISPSKPPDTTTPPNTSVPGTPPATGVPTSTTSAEKFAAEYAADPKAADARYRGKWVQIEGEVGFVAFDYLTMGTPGSSLYMVVERVGPASLPRALGKCVVCTFFTSGLDKVRDLAPYQKITFRGLCQGYTAQPQLERGTVNLTDCELLKAGPDTSLVITAAEICKEYSANKEKFDATIVSKGLILEGTVVSFDDQEFLLGGSGEQGGKPIRVCLYPIASEAKTFMSRKPGDKVKIRGRCTGGSIGIRGEPRVFVKDCRLVK
jgi:hypothetical protein